MHHYPFCHKWLSLIGLFILLLLFSAQYKAENSHLYNYQSTAQQLILQHRYEEAFELYASAIQQFEQTENWEQYYPAIRAKWDLLRIQFDYEASLTLIEDAVASYPTHFKDTLSLEAGELHLRLAKSISVTDDKENTERIANKALDIFRAHNATSQAGKAKRLLGNLYCDHNDSEKGFAFLEEALELLKREEEDNIREIGYCLLNLSYHYNMLYHNPEKVISYSEQALHYSTLAKDTASIRLAYSNLALSYSALRSFQLSLEYAYREQELSLNFFGPDHENTGYTYNTLANIYYRMKDYRQSLKYARLGYETFRKAIGPTGSMTLTMLMNMGVDHNYLGEYEKALKIYRQVIALEDSFAARSYDRVKVYRNMGTTYLMMGDTLNARRKYVLAKERAEKVLDPQSLVWGSIYLDLAETSTSFDEADEWTNKAFRICLKNGDSILQMEAKDFDRVYNLNDMLDVLNMQTILALNRYKKSKEVEDLNRAKRFATMGIDFINYIWRTRDTEASKLVLMQTSRAYLETAATISRSLYELSPSSLELDNLLSIIEKHKSLLLTEALTTKQANAQLGIPENLLQQETELLEKIAQEKQLLIGSASQETDNVIVYRRISELRDSLTNLRMTITANYPRFEKLNYGYSNITSKNIQAYLTNEQTALIEYFFDRDGLIILAFTQEQTHFHYQPLAADFDEQLATLRQLSSQPPTKSMKSEEAEQLFCQTAYDLYCTLLAPVLTQFPELNQLIIIPDGKIGYVPFELLLSHPVEATGAFAYRSMPFVIKEQTIQYEYAFKLLQASTLYSKQIKTELLAMAPYFGETDGQLSLRGEMDSLRYAQAFPGLRNGISPLKYNTVEAEHIAAIVKGDALIGDKATKTAFKQKANEYGILHLATHAFVNDLYPDYSHFVFNGVQDSSESRFLYAYELYNMNLQADLAVLSACETGVGKLQSGEGIMSLSRAFKYAGCPNIVTSLWKAEDQSTQEIMLKFYDYLRKGKGKATALKQAKLDFLSSAEQRFTHPFYWSTFILIGNDAPLVISKPWKMSWLWAAGLLGLAGIFVWYKRLNV